MTIKELITKLQTLDSELHVFVNGYEGRYDDINVSSVREVALNVYDDYYYGNHGDVDYDFVKKGNYTIVKGIIL